MRLGYHSITWGGVGGHPVGVTSVKDLYYLTNGSMETAVRDIAAAGYEGTEMFDGNLVEYADRPDELRETLSNAGLELVSVYTGANFIYADILPDELHRIRRAAELATIFGAERLVVGGGARRAAGTTDEDYDRLGTALDRVTDIAEEFGLSASYHPHLTTIVESPDELDRLMSKTRIGFCPDTAHLAAGGGDPAAAIRKYPDRIRHVHLKDFKKDPFQFLPLGEGDLDFPDIIRAVKESGYDSWLMVELDSYDGDPRAAAEISKKYLDKILAESGIQR
ncbi:sugar phosphate isomerase/epimerase family protein [Pseudarthrobacter raffinosi]|uniref:sugar phosphate isomerase/epimerase family protein n=1 Tax=Pseudarthrobacter raffinosi TaxID=2953651 RepID=UPI00208E3F19|nr:MULTISPECIES: sugar phosphate isomerase/epimerase [unclassified Pseudarthrobacter]MCO4252008.1 sugar phosphate isomerase/epimerase [Pseudarthrobacter sp. MDT3-9]MCO4262846.1 sugar phosphate isomerase/epimerase [Pseudarthrobacter sp. MDT3-26]